MAWDEERLAQFLGWFSIGLGLAEFVAPDTVAQLIGVPDNEESRSLLRKLGVRELVSGIGILTQERPAGWVWSRVAGDAMDLSLLGKAMASQDAQHGRLAMATASVVGVTLLDLYDSLGLSSNGNGGNGSHKNGSRSERSGAMDVKKSITINGTPDTLYAYWRNFENLPTFMRHLESVKVTGGTRSHWVAKAPAGKTVEWDAEITEDRPNELIAWRSVDGADVPNSGTVTFSPATGGRGTVVRVTMQYNPPGGVIGATVAKLFGEEPSLQVYDDLRAFKQVMELGEVVLSDGSISGARLLQRPAQPAEQPRELVGAR